MIILLLRVKYFDLEERPGCYYRRVINEFLFQTFQLEYYRIVNTFSHDINKVNLRTMYIEVNDFTLFLNINYYYSIGVSMLTI
jgi:hypothetical protein